MPANNDAVSVVAYREPAPSVGRIVVSFIADTGDGSVPAIALPAIEGRLLSITTDPGTPAPSADWDITLVDTGGFDILGGAGADRHTSNALRAAITSGYLSRDESYALTITGNSENGAKGVVTLHYTTGAD